MNLPYEFDLLYDIKTYDEIEAIARDEPSHSDATPEELASLFDKLNIERPPCLKNTPAIVEIWVRNDHTWQYDEPPREERHLFTRTTIRTYKDQDT